MLYNLCNAKIQIIYMDDDLPNYIHLFLIFWKFPLVKSVCPDMLDETFDSQSIDLFLIWLCIP